jgi:hypothetical protein
VTIREHQPTRKEEGKGKNDKEKGKTKRKSTPLPREDISGNPMPDSVAPFPFPLFS